MREHHRQACDRLVAEFEGDPSFRAVILSGSVSRDWARDDSEIDLILIATDQEYARRRRSDDIHYLNTEVDESGQWKWLREYFDGADQRRGSAAELSKVHGFMTGA